MSRPVAIVTGASRGIGRAVAHAVGRAQCDLVLTARTASALEETAAPLREAGLAVTCVAADLRDPAAAATILAAAPGGAVDLLVNNAGTAPSARLQDTTDEDLAETFDLHVGAPLRLLRSALPGMVQRGSGCAIQLASTAGLRGFPFTSAYTAAKHGMVGLTRAVAAEFARTPVSIYGLCPGFVDTEITRRAAAAVAAKGKTSADEALARMGAMNAIGRIHSADEVAAAVLHLWQQRPKGCIYVLDRDPPGFVDDDA